ncbi:MAG TPA: GMP synthase subunit A [Thermoplasmatales archaeon]|nr:GMP synthase subunit A [Thermoplasmatales archaeon]
MRDLKIYVIDNGGQWTHREWRVLKYLGVQTHIVPNTTPYDTLIEKNVDGIILSGGAPRIGLKDSLGRCNEYLEKADFPILGICAGHQFIARFFGGKVEPAVVPEFGRVELIIDKEHELFSEVPKRSVVWSSHNDEITLVPKDFNVLAHSNACEVQAMAHKNKSIFGLQFHPEVEHTEYGVQIFRNFVEICKRQL